MAEKRTKKYKGVFQPDKPIVEKKWIALPVSLPERKSIRYRCARISNKNWEVKDGLKEKIEKQFTKDMNWDNFLEVWDISKEPPYKVVEKKG